MKKVLVAVVVVLACSFTVQAVQVGPVWIEDGDAGELVPTAQNVDGVGVLNTIVGILEANGAVDLYRIQICDPYVFTAGISTSWDPQLSLFDNNGLGVYHNDDYTGLQSFLTAQHPYGPVLPGLYLLGVSSFSNDPLSAGGVIFGSGANGGVPPAFAHAPDGPGGAQPLSGWEANFGGSSGSYEIRLTGACFTDTQPVPDGSMTLGLLGAALGGLAILRRRA